MSYNTFHCLHSLFRAECTKFINLRHNSSYMGMESAIRYTMSLDVSAGKPHTRRIPFLQATQKLSISLLSKFHIIPVFKKGHPCRAENYQLISITSQICKVAEAIILHAFTKHLETHKLIRDSQHGFRARRSCLTNLLSNSLISRQGT